MKFTLSNQKLYFKSIHLDMWNFYKVNNKNVIDVILMFFIDNFGQLLLFSEVFTNYGYSYF